jgi:hypothetical protein
MGRRCLGASVAGSWWLVAGASVVLTPEAPRHQPPRNRLQAFQLHPRIARRVHFCVGLGHFSFFVDHVGDASGVFIFRRIGGAVGESDLSFGVAEEREGEVVFLGEAAVFFGGIEADAEDFRVLFLVLAVEVPEPGTFPRSAGCVGLRIEPEHDFLSAQLTEPDSVAVVVGHIEIRGLLPNVDHLSLPAEHGLQNAFECHETAIVGVP